MKQAYKALQSAHRCFSRINYLFGDFGDSLLAKLQQVMEKTSVELLPQAKKERESDLYTPQTLKQVEPGRKIRAQQFISALGDRLHERIWRKEIAAGKVLTVREFCQSLKHQYQL